MRRMTKAKRAGERLRDARKKAHLTQQQLADKAGVVRMTIVRLEKGKQPGVNIATLRKIAAALGVRLLDLADIEESPIEPIVKEYLNSPYAQIDKPTDPEIEWISSQSQVFWGKTPPNPAAIHDLIEWSRKHSPQR